MGIKGERTQRLKRPKGSRRYGRSERNKMQAAMERAKGKTKAAGERIKGTANNEGQDRVKPSRIYSLRIQRSFLLSGQNESTVMYHCHRNASCDSRELAP
jgi:hypothetical protein